MDDFRPDPLTPIIQVFSARPWRSGSSRGITWHAVAVKGNQVVQFSVGNLENGVNCI